MDAAYLSALSALAGSVVGGLTTGMTTWLSLRSQARAGRLALELTRRQELFRDFIAAASKLYGEALMSNEPQLQEVVGLYALVSRMRVLCRPKTIAAADRIVAATVEAFFAPNKTMRELHELVKSGVEIDPLREFSEAAREEVLAFH